MQEEILIPIKFMLHVSHHVIKLRIVIQSEAMDLSSEGKILRFMHRLTIPGVRFTRQRKLLKLLKEISADN